MAESKLIVYKQIIPVDDQVHSISLPVKAEIVYVGKQGRTDEVVFWYTRPVEDTPERVHYFLVIGTGMTIPSGSHYLGTVVDLHSVLVWHLFEVPAGWNASA